MAGLGKMLILSGALLALIGTLMVFSHKIPWIGRLPGDIHIQGRNASFYFPVVTCIILSVVLSILMNVFFRK